MTTLSDREQKKGQRVLQLRLQLGLNQTDFGAKLTRNNKPVSQNYISAIEQGRKKLGDDVQSRIEARFNVRRQWLDEGVGAMLTDEAVEPTTEQQLRLKAALGSFNLPNIKTKGAGNLTWVAVRERGAFLRGQGDTANLRRTPFPILPDNVWAFEVADNRMLPVYALGSWVICSQLESALYMVSGVSYAIQTSDHLMVAVFKGKAEEDYQFEFTNEAEIVNLNTSVLAHIYHIEFKLLKA